jgi:hypothetical protein
MFVYLLLLFLIKTISFVKELITPLSLVLEIR